MPSAALPAGQERTGSLQATGNRPPAPFHLRDVRTQSHSLTSPAERSCSNIWATECGGCRKELPAFANLRQSYRPDDVTIVGVSMDVSYEDLKSTAEAWARVTPFAREHGLGYTILVDDGSVEKAYKVTALPVTYLIDTRGRVAATYVGVIDPASVAANIKALLAESR